MKKNIKQKADMSIEKKEFDKRFSDLFVEAFKFTEEEFDFFISHFRRKELKKKQFYSRAGDISKDKAYINKGCTRTFVIDENGYERILFFSFEDWWLCDWASFNSGKPGKEYVEAIEDCELLVISKSDWEKMEKEIPKMLQWYTVKVPKSAGAMANRLIESKICSPEENYLNLLQKQPQIFQRVPLRFIAAYLNIQPESLSRMRRRLAKKK
jgi:CRP-like cAMP-binding protein